MVEYAILIGVLSFGVVAIIGAFEQRIYDLLNKAATVMEAAN